MLKIISSNKNALTKCALSLNFCLSAILKLRPNPATHWVHSEASDQTGWMSRLNWIFAGCTVILLVLSWGGSYFYALSSLLSRSSGPNYVEIIKNSVTGIYDVGHFDSVMLTLSMTFQGTWVLIMANQVPARKSKFLPNRQFAVFINRNLAISYWAHCTISG